MTETNDEDEKLSVRDAVVRANGFKAWLNTTADPRFDPIKTVMPSTGGAKVDFELIEYNIQESYPDRADELTELLLQAQLEWKIDANASDGARRALEVRSGSTHDFADPTPIDGRRCRYLLGRGDPDAKKCGQPTVPGTVRCQRHGGELVDADTRRAVLMTSYLQLVEATSDAVDVLVDVAVHSRNDLARVAAAKEILDRAGLTPELQVSVKFESEGRTEKMDQLKSKLDTMQRGLQERAIDAVARETAETG